MVQPHTTPFQNARPHCRSTGHRVLAVYALLAMVFLAWSMTAPRVLAQALPAGSDQVLVEVDQFGVGESVRPGSWAGIRLRLTNRLDTVRTIAVQLHLRDDDGDTALYTRSILLNARATEATWLYAPMPWNLTPERQFVVTVHEFDETEETADAAIGRRIAAARINPQTNGVTDPARSMVGIVGQRNLGLNQYELFDAQGRILTTVHESADIRANINPILLPDSWLGLAPYETLVWTNAEFRELGTREDPRVKAMIEWVHRGGHLVIAMPPLGGDVLTPSNPLLDPESVDPLRNIMPIVRARRIEDVNLEHYRALLTTADFDDRALPFRTGIHVFDPVDPSQPLQAIPLIRGPEGTVVVRRVIGAGMVTLIGLDLFDPELAREGTLRADAFWNRILGKRVDVPMLQTLPQFGSRETARPDGYLAVMIAWGTTAGVGVILALIVFAAYWVLAGPGGFGLLKIFKKTQHAWLAFILTAAAFTAIGWAGATAIKQTSTSANHITFFDHVYGSNAQRARSWASVFLPDYGEQTIAIDNPADASIWNNALTTWSAPGRVSALEFPDARPYTVNVLQIDRRRLPARSTTKDFQIDWLGRSTWKLPVPVAQGWEPTLEWPAGALVQGVRNVPTIRGRIAHDLPDALRRVSIILVTDQLSEAAERDARARDTRGLILSNAYMAQVTAWQPGDVLDLSSVFAGLSPTALASEREALRLDAATRSRFRQTAPPGLTLGNISLEPERRDGREQDAWDILSLYSMLPPLPESSIAAGSNELRIIRRATHGLDISPWLTQPVLIIIGTIETDDAPITLTEGPEGSARPIPMSGTTIVRWIYPLEPRPTRFTGVARDPEAAAERREELQRAAAGQ